MRTRERITITLRQDFLAQVDDYIGRGKARNRSHAIERILAAKFGDHNIRRAIILGGGEGVVVDAENRTSPLLARHNGRPLVEYHIEKLKSMGVEEVILAVGPFGEDVRAVVGDGSSYGVKVVYFVHGSGTASVLRQAQSMLTETFVMFNGHIIVDDIDFDDMLITHKNRKGLATVALTTVSDPGGYGQLVMRGTNVVNYVEKPGKKDTVSHMINAGIYVMEPAVCDLVESEEKSLERDVFPVLAQQGELSGYMLDVPWSRVKHD